MTANEFNRGCWSILAGMLGGAVGAIVFVTLAFVVTIAACILGLFVLTEIVDNLPQREVMMEALKNNNFPGTIRTNVLGGTLTVNQSVDLNNIDFTPDPELRGETIRVMDAERKYGVPQRTISNWARTGLVRVVDRGPKLLLLEESSVARATAIFRYAKRFVSSRKAGWVLKRALAS